MIKERDDFLLLIVGDGSMKKELKDFVERGQLKDKVIFLGERKDIPEIISCCDFLVLPSRMEGFGISILEGYVFSKPVVATKVGGIPEIVVDERTGLLFEVENFYELSQKICYLLDNPEKIIEMGKNGRRYLEENFSFDKMKETLLKLYKEI